MKKILLIISIFYTILWNNTYAESWEIIESKSIKEIKKDIDKLHIDRNNINNELTILTQDNNFISYLVKNWFFRENINRNELQNIELLIRNYNKAYSDVNTTLLDKSKNLEDIYVEKKLLLDIKKELYQELINYIQQDKFKEYLDFIRNDANILKKDSDVKYSLIQSKEVLTNKVSKIEERIQEERKIMSDNLKLRVWNKIDEKINSIKNNPKFITLSIDFKYKVIEKTISRVNQAIDKTKGLQNKDNILEQKIEIYQLLRDKLIEYHNTLEIKKEWE
jgi:hypothetical protein